MKLLKKVDLHNTTLFSSQSSDLEKSTSRNFGGRAIGNREAENWHVTSGWVPTVIVK